MHSSIWKRCTRKLYAHHYALINLDRGIMYWFIKCNFNQRRCPSHHSLGNNDVPRNLLHRRSRFTKNASRKYFNRRRPIRNSKFFSTPPPFNMRPLPLRHKVRTGRSRRPGSSPSLRRVSNHDSRRYCCKTRRHSGSSYVDCR